MTSQITAGHSSKSGSLLAPAGLFGDLAELLKTTERDLESDKEKLRAAKKRLKINQRLKDAIEYHLGIKPDYEI